MIHHEDVVRIYNLFHIVSDQDDRDTLLFVQFTGSVNDFLPAVRV